jgi:hypothetical protein
MNIAPRGWKGKALGLLLLTAMYGCAETGVGYVGVGYEPYGYEYGHWGRGYQVTPSHSGERRQQQSTPRAYRPAPQSRPAPSIPKRERERRH